MFVARGHLQCLPARPRRFLRPCGADPFKGRVTTLAGLWQTCQVGLTRPTPEQWTQGENPALPVPKHFGQVFSLASGRRRLSSCLARVARSNESRSTIYSPFADSAVTTWQVRSNQAS